MDRRTFSLLLAGFAGSASVSVAADIDLKACPPGVSGGRLVLALRAEPRTLNPVAALDAGSREVISLITAPLIDLDQNTFSTVAGLATNWTASPDLRRFTLHLRRGLRFSNGQPFTADDVVFTFHAHQDQNTHSPQRELLIVGGRAISVTKLDPFTVQFDLAEPYPVGERLFTGLGILPQGALEADFRRGVLNAAWGLATPPSGIAGLGPFAVKEYVPGERLVLARNPYYWKTDSRSSRLPYLDEIVVEFAANEDVQALRLLSGEADLVEGLSADTFAALKAEQARRGLQLYDQGPGLEYTCLLLNQNRSTPAGASLKQRTAWFRTAAFRQALSAAIDRDAIARIAYHGVATPIWAHVTPGNKRWVNDATPHPPRSVARARELLRGVGFSWNSANLLVDPQGNPVTFSILASASNTQSRRIATLLQADLQEIGITVSIASLEFRALVDHVFNTRDYDAAVMTLGSGDTDPNSEMNVWTVNGDLHLWNLGGRDSEPWETEIDGLMRKQMVCLSFQGRKRLYDRVQYLVATELPVICMVSPHVLVAASRRVRNLRPSILRPYALWNADELYSQPDGTQPQPRPPPYRR